MSDWNEYAAKERAERERTKGMIFTNDTPAEDFPVTWGPLDEDGKLLDRSLWDVEDFEENKAAYLALRCFWDHLSVLPYFEHGQASISVSIDPLGDTVEWTSIGLEDLIIGEMEYYEKEPGELMAIARSLEKCAAYIRSAVPPDQQDAPPPDGSEDTKRRYDGTVL